MIHYCKIGIVTLVVTVILTGCSGTGNPTTPVIPQQQDISNTSQASHYLWSYNMVYVNPSQPGGITVEIIPIRQIMGHWNALSWLEQWPCTNCFKITNIEPSGTGTLLVDIEITHPFDNLNLTGFDVRGIAMFNGSHEFPEAGLTISDRTIGEGELVNADGYTTLYNPTTEGCGPGGLQGYIKGKLATTQYPNATLNGYKRHIVPTANLRNAFYAGEASTATYEIDMPDGPFVFGYAVDSNWATPINKPVDDPMDDFPLEANCDEPWKIEVSGDPIGASGETELTIDVYDWQGPQSHHFPLLECPELFDGWITPDFDAFYDGFARFTVTIQNSNSAPSGSYKCMVMVEDNANGAAPDWLNLTAYQIYLLKVSAMQGWARTWGGPARGNAVAVDDSGNAIIVGQFEGTIDFNPGEQEDYHTSNGGNDCFASKFDPDGFYDWSVTWGGSKSGSYVDSSIGISVDGNGNVYVVGYYWGTADFDPGPGTDQHPSNGDMDAFLIKFTPSGTFEWGKNWGGAGWDRSCDVAADESGSIYVTGYFRGTNVDFRPRLWDC